MVHRCAKQCNVADACSESYKASDSGRYWDWCQLEKLTAKFKRGNKRALSRRLGKIQTRTTSMFALANSGHNTTVNNSSYQLRKRHQIRTRDVQKGHAFDCFWLRYAIFPLVQQSAYVLHAWNTSAVLIYDGGLLLLEISWGRHHVYFNVDDAICTDLLVLRLLISSNGFPHICFDFLCLQNHHCHAILQPS